jgi:hypothetical protein
MSWKNQASPRGRAPEDFLLGSRLGYQVAVDGVPRAGVESLWCGANVRLRMRAGALRALGLECAAP